MSSRKQRQEKVAGKISCTQCRRTFDSMARLEEHRGEMGHVCDQCGAHFQYQSGLTTHMADKHGEDVRCDKCGANLGRRDNHARHNHRFHETSEWYWCGYEGCTKEDYSQWNIKKHMENPSHPSHIGKTKKGIIKGVKTAADKELGVRGVSPSRSTVTEKLTADQPTVADFTPRSVPRRSYADVVKRSASASPPPVAHPMRLEFPGSLGANDYQNLVHPQTDISPSSVHQPSPPASPYINEELYQTFPPNPHEYNNFLSPNASYQNGYLHPSTSYNENGNQPFVPAFLQAWNMDTPLVGDGSMERHNYLSENLARSVRNPYVTAQAGINEQARLANRGTKSMPPMPQNPKRRRAARMAGNRRRVPTLRVPAQATRGSDRGNISPYTAQQAGLALNSGSHFSATPQQNGAPLLPNAPDHQRNVSSSISRQSDIGKLDMSELVSQIDDYVNRRHNFSQDPRQADYDRRLLQDFFVFSTGGHIGRPNPSTNPMGSSSMLNGRHPTPPVDMDINVSDPPDLTEEYETITTLGFVPEKRSGEQIQTEPRQVEQPHLAVTPDEVPNIHWLNSGFPSIYNEGYHEGVILTTNDISVEEFNNEVDDKMEMSLYSDPSTTRAQ